MHDEQFLEFLKTNYSTNLLLESVLDVSEKTNLPIQKIIPGVYDYYLKSHDIYLENIEID